jgi:hypothetical protein
MFYYILGFVCFLFLVLAIIAFVLYLRGHRYFKTREERETEEGIQKTFGSTSRWGLMGAADNEMRSHTHQSDHGSDFGDHGSSGGDFGGGGGD